MDKPSNKQKRRTNPILWFIFAVIIPLLIAITITVFILVFMGVDVKGWIQDTGSKIPGVSSFIKAEEEISLEKENQKAKEVIEEQEAEMEILNKDILALKEIIEGLEQEVVKVKNTQKNEEQKAEDVENLDENESGMDESLKAVAASFRKMDTKQAALIFADFDTPTAISILKQLSNDVRGGILEAMEPKKAAELMKGLIDEN